MKKSIIKVILSLMSFVIVLGISIPNVSALSYPCMCGYVDKRIIQKVMKLHENEIQYCYNKALLKDHTLTGRIVTIFLILGDGTVGKILIKESTLNSPEVEHCVVEQIKTWTFPRTRNRELPHSCCNDAMIQIEYPYEFVSNYKPPTVLERFRLILNEDDMVVNYFEVTPVESENSESEKSTEPDSQ